MLTIAYSTREHKPEFKKQIEDTIGIRDFEILEFVNNGEKSLTQVYNEGLNQSKNNNSFFGIYSFLLFFLVWDFFVPKVSSVLAQA